MHRKKIVQIAASDEVSDFAKAGVVRLNATTGAIFEGSFHFMANTGIENLRDNTILDESKLEPVRIAVV